MPQFHLHFLNLFCVILTPNTFSKNLRLRVRYFFGTLFNILRGKNLKQCGSRLRQFGMEFLINIHIYCILLKRPGALCKTLVEIFGETLDEILSGTFGNTLGKKFSETPCETRGKTVGEILSKILSVTVSNAVGRILNEAFCETPSETWRDFIRDFKHEF